MKKVVSIILSLILLVNSTAIATNIKEARNELKIYCTLDEWDFLGRNGEKLYFQLQDEYAQGSRIKELIFDMGTLDLQLKMSAKAYKDNDYIYDTMLFLAGLKYFAVPKKLTKTQKLKLSKLLIKLFKPMM